MAVFKKFKVYYSLRGDPTKIYYSKIPARNSNNALLRARARFGKKYVIQGVKLIK